MLRINKMNGILRLMMLVIVGYGINDAANRFLDTSTFHIPSSIITYSKKDLILKKLTLNLQRLNNPEPLYVSAQEALLTPEGLKLFQVTSLLNNEQGPVTLKSPLAFWPFNQNKIFFFDQFSIKNSDVSMDTSSFIVDFDEQMCYSHSPTYWHYDGLNVSSKEFAQPIEEVKSIFSRSS